MWLLWLIIILLIIGAVWWFLNRNKTTATSTARPTGTLASGAAPPSAAPAEAAGDSGVGAASFSDTPPAPIAQEPIERGAPVTPPVAEEPVAEEPVVEEPVVDEPPAYEASGGSHAAETSYAASEPVPAPLTDPLPEAPADPASSVYDSPTVEEPVAEETPAATTGPEPVAFDAEPAGTTAPSEQAAFAGVPAGRYGEGSADPTVDGSAPEGWTIKGSEDSKKYHTPESPWYERTQAEVWFESEGKAQSAGFKRWDDHS